MVLHTWYKNESGNRVYLESVDATNAFYRVGSALIKSTIEYFASRYSLGY